MPDFPKKDNCCCECKGDWVSKKELNAAIAQLKRDLLNAIVKVAKPCCSGSDSDIEDLINNEIIPRIEALEAIDYSEYVTAEDI